MEDWKYFGTYSGTPQGGIISPVLANIYLHEFDNWAANRIKAFNKGKTRKYNQDYHNLTNAKTRLRMKLRKRKAAGEDYSDLLKEIKELESKTLKLPSKDPKDPDYRRLLYCRYADDFIFGVIGSKAEAKEILEELRKYIETKLSLELSEGKTGIKHSSDKTVFLGYEITTYCSDRVRKIIRKGQTVRKRTYNGAVSLKVPKEKIVKFVKNHKIGIYETGKTFNRFPLTNRSDLEILCTYNAELRGFANYYILDRRVKQHLNKLQWMYHDSLAKTLANKHKTQKSKIYRKYRVGSGEQKRLAVHIEIKGQKKVYKVFKLKDLKTTTNIWDEDIKPNTFIYTLTRSELQQRLNAEKCEFCGSNKNVEVHHVRKLKDVVKGKALWQVIMAAMKRKTLVVCRECHQARIHHGRSPKNKNT